VSQEALERAREGFEAWRRGDFESVEALLAPSAQWHWWEPGEWDCKNRDEIMRTLRERHEQGFGKGEIDFVDAGDDKVILVSHPRRTGGEEWPEETATVVTFRDGTVAAMQDYPTRAEALAAVLLRPR
jgi:ketosteroid isomerase-like protein